MTIALTILIFPNVQADDLSGFSIKQHKLIYDFKQPGEFKFWRILNDNVMGGLTAVH